MIKGFRSLNKCWFSFNCFTFAALTCQQVQTVLIVGGGGGVTGGLRAPSWYIFLTHIFGILRCWILLIFLFPAPTRVPRVCLVAILAAILNFHKTAKVGVGVTFLIITSVILIYFHQMRYQNLKYFISQILRPVTFWLVNYERSFGVKLGQKGHKGENLLFILFS